jgi:hypothetical protein
MRVIYGTDVPDWVVRNWHSWSIWRIRHAVRAQCQWLDGVNLDLSVASSPYKKNLLNLELLYLHIIGLLCPVHSAFISSTIIIFTNRCRANKRNSSSRWCDLISGIITVHEWLRKSILDEGATLIIEPVQGDDVNSYFKEEFCLEKVIVSSESVPQELSSEWSFQ